MASGLDATAMGNGTEASGANATAMGYQTTAQAQALLALGQFNTIEGNQTEWIPTDPVLIVGNGTEDQNGSPVPFNALTLYKNGNMTLAGSLTENSDRRLKTDIAPLGRVLEGVCRRQAVLYRFKDTHTHPEGEHLGLVAQDVQAVFPELVSQSSDGRLSLAYSRLTAVVVQAVREQQAQIEGLEARLAKLEGLLSVQGDGAALEVEPAKV